MTSVKYLVITPARDEAQHLEETIRCMVRQSIRPVKWVLVNDGSSDGTAAIIDSWASREPWIIAVHLPDRRGQSNAPNRGQRALKAKEIEAFYEGFGFVASEAWDFIVKLDADLGFEPDYFERCFAKFRDEAGLGVGGGVICHLDGEQLQVERTPRFHVRGATKIYKRACWEAIGGVINGAGWDTVDEVKANMLGWATRSFEDLRVIHYRHTGAANGVWNNAVKNGAWNYSVGYHPLFMVVKCAKNIFDRPFGIRGIGLFWGFVGGYLRRLPQLDDVRVIRYLRQQQIRKLSFREGIWH
ncbi:MAG: glycosyltransferase family A protein [Bryobacteraceae bacterium]